jgi:hypothetical protein
MLWPILWILFLLGLVTAFLVVSLKEKSARKKLASAKAPVAMPAEPLANDGFGDDGFGAADQFNFDNK